ncbi:MAG: hypothetical protein KBB71_04820 [Lentimicrobiaceae bacterium]|nr:hypothetical protein [Lentimicrobiaceae bacterium]
MKKKTIPIPVELVKKLKKKMEESYSGDIIDGFTFYLNQNIEILKREGIIFDQVVIIKDLKRGVIENGHITHDIITNAIIRAPFQAKKKLIKALIIAAFSKDWEIVYNEYYNRNGDLINSEASGKVIKNTDLEKVLRTITLENWNASANFSTPQWANYVRVPIENGLIKRIRCQIITTSEYYRFGFKLFRKNGKLFGDGSIQSLDNNFVIHIGKNFLSDVIKYTIYRNGIRQRPSGDTEAKPSNNRMIVELFIDNEDILYLLLNGSEVSKSLINKEIREKVYLLAWGDGNEFQIRVENIEIEFESA